MLRSACCLAVLMIVAGSVCTASGQEAPATQPGAIQLKVGNGTVIIRGGGTVRLNGILIQPAQVPQPEGPNPYEQMEPRDRHFASDIAYAGPLDSLVRDLESTSFSERQQAMDTLLRLSPDRLEDVKAALAHETSAEAVARLTQVAVHLYMKARTPLEGTSAMMGLMYSPELIRLNPKSDEQRVSIAVMDLLPGYPAAQELRIGDRLIAVDGQAFPMGIPTIADENGTSGASDEFKRMVSSRKPGEVVPFTVIRNGKQLEISVQLAALAGMNANDMRDQRADAIARFTSKLKSGLKEKPLIIKDDTAGASIYDENLQK